MTTLDDAKEWLRARFEKGADCPCCGQFVKLYKRSLTSTMAYGLVLIARYFEAQPGEEWLHVNEYLGRVCGPELDARIRGDVAKLAHWGLIEREIGSREDGSDRTGYWRITDLGRDFAMGRGSIPKYVYLYNQRPITRSDPDRATITIRDALRDKFNYSELMAATPEGPRV